MTTIMPNRVNVRPHGTASTLEEDLNKARLLARLLDAQFDIAGFKFGLDAIVGLVPVVGDTVSLFAGLYPIYLVRKHKLGKTLQSRMMMNLFIDYIGGLIPVLGDVFDVLFKANLKNFDLLERAVQRRAQRRG